MADLTPSQTVGPYFAYALTPRDYGRVEFVTGNLVTPSTTGERIRIEGRVRDGDGAPVPDAMIEIWQADAEGRYAHPADERRPNSDFVGFGRAAIGADGAFFFETIKPGPVPGPDGAAQAPHISVGVFARGVLKRLHTRLYFDGEAANAADPVLALVPAERRATLVARKAGEGRYTWDIVLQGEGETVFFEA